MNASRTTPPAGLISLVLATAVAAGVGWERAGRPFARPLPAPGAAGSGSAQRGARPPVDPEALKRARSPERGAELYAHYCALCHGADAHGYAADNAPSLVSTTFLATATDVYLRRSIQEGRPGTAMGAYGKRQGGPLEDIDVAAIIAFVRQRGKHSVPLPPHNLKGDVLRGQAVWAANCATCHGTRDQRATAVHLANPEFLRVANDAFLRHAIVHGRPETPMPAWGGKLTPRQIDDVVALIRSWAPPGAQGIPEPPPVPEIPADLPVVLNPDGPMPRFTLKQDRYVPADDVLAALKARQRIVIVDARSPAEWHRLRVDGAIPGPYHDLSRLDAVPKDGTWVIAYCACPHHASGAVVDELRKRGYKRTAILDEGINVWHQRGYPVAGSMANDPLPARAPVPAGSVMRPILPFVPGSAARPPVALPGAPSGH